MTRWNLTIPDEADRLVRAFMTRSGMTRRHLSAFVVEACRREMLRRTVAEVRRQNANLGPEEAMRIAEEAVAAARRAGR